MSDIVRGTIVDADSDGLIIRVPYRDWEKFTRQRCNTALVQIPDGRRITERQMGFVWAMMTQIGTQSGYAASQIYKYIYEAYFLPRFRLAILPSLRQHALRLSNATEEEAQTIINVLIDFCVENGIQTAKPLTEYTDDIAHYVYSCLMNKKCCVCGKKADLHHVDAVGMGRDRTEICHIGMECLPICRQHHTEAHNIGNDTFISKYHLQTVKINEEVAQKYKLGVEKKC